MALDLNLLDCHASRMLKAIESTLEGKVTKDSHSMSHNGKSITRYSFDELRALRREYRAEYREELKDEGLIPRSNKIRTRFV